MTIGSSSSASCGAERVPWHHPSPVHPALRPVPLSSLAVRGQAGCLPPPMTAYPGSRDEASGGCVLSSGRQGGGRQCSAGKAAGAIRMRGCGGWSSCGPSRCRSRSAGPRRTPHRPPLSPHPLGTAGETRSGSSGLPFPPHPFSPYSPGSESWDESKLSARARSPLVGDRSSSSRCRRLRCRLRSRSLALCAFSSCSSNLCGDPLSYERGAVLSPLGGPLAGAPAGGPQAATGPPPRPSPGCEAGPGAGGSAWWTGPTPRPPAPAASTAPGSTAAGLSCGRGNDTAVSPGARPPPAPPFIPCTCASPARCAPTCGRAPGDQNRRYRPPLSRPPHPPASPGPAAHLTLPAARRDLEA